MAGPAMRPDPDQPMTKFSIIAAAAALALSLNAEAAEKSVPPVPFTEAYLSDEANIVAGGEIWADQCRHCHGAKAYPGKAPKLKPARYKPNFVYRRVTDGFLYR